MIISIPHSGTRALRAELGHHRHTHFGITFEKRIFTRDWGHVDIPIRNPIRIGISWHANYHEKQIKNRSPAVLYESFEQMFRYIKERSGDITLWQSEVLPYLESSRGAKSEVRTSLHVLEQSPYVGAVLDFLGSRRDARNFYSQFYLDVLPTVTVATRSTGLAAFLR